MIVSDYFNKQIALFGSFFKIKIESEFVCNLPFLYIEIDYVSEATIYVRKLETIPCILSITAVKVAFCLHYVLIF